MSSTTIIVGDLHLGKRHNVTYGDSKIWDDRSLLILDGIIRDNEPDHLILAGDVFDTSKPSSLVYSELIAVIAHVPSVTIIAGNHDISKITEDIAFDNLQALKNVYLVEYNTVSNSPNDKWNYIGWQPTQMAYDSAMRSTIAACIEGGYIITHCSRLDFGNLNDNICTDEHIKLAKAKDIKIISGHEHTAHLGDTFSFLGSVVPHTIAETGTRYVWMDGDFIALEPMEDIILTREEPIEIDPNKVYYVKTGKEITVEDLKMEAKDLGIDIVEDFMKKAEEAGFNVKELLK